LFRYKSKKHIERSKTVFVGMDFGMSVYNVNQQQEASNNAMCRTRLALQKSNIELAEVAIEDDLIQRAKRLS
jgi:hypothetical protein